MYSIKNFNDVKSVYEILKTKCQLEHNITFIQVENYNITLGVYNVHKNITVLDNHAYVL